MKNSYATIKNLISFLDDVFTAKKIKRKEPDFFGRLLRYVYFEDSDVNLKMIEDGYANVYTKFKFTKSKEYINLNK